MLVDILRGFTQRALFSERFTQIRTTIPQLGVSPRRRLNSRAIKAMRTKDFHHGDTESTEITRRGAGPFIAGLRARCAGLSDVLLNRHIQKPSIPAAAVRQSRLRRALRPACRSARFQFSVNPQWSPCLRGEFFFGCGFAALRRTKKCAEAN